MLIVIVFGFLVLTLVGVLVIFVLLLGSSLVSWQSKKQQIVSIVRVILKYSFEVYYNYLRILNAYFQMVCILYIVDNPVSNGIAED